MVRVLHFVLVVLFAGFLQGCSFVECEVSVVHELAGTGGMQKYAFAPSEDQAGKPEYSAYEDLIRAELGGYNYAEVDVSKARYSVSFGYAVDDGVEELVTVPAYGFGGVTSPVTNVRYNSYANRAMYSGNTAYRPAYGVVGSTRVSRTVYGRSFWLHISEIKSSVVEVDNVYEGSVKSRGGSGELVGVMPAMIKALFKEFPGKSGVVRREITALE